MKHTKVIRRSKTATREVLKSKAKIISLIADCKAIQVLQVTLGTDNSLLQARMASKTAQMSAELNGTDKYNVPIGPN